MGDNEEREQSEDDGASGPRVNIGGDVGGNVEIAGKDIIHGDVVGGDKISVGDIKDSKGVAIGRDAQASVTEGVDSAALAEALSAIEARLKALENIDAQDVSDATETTEELFEEIQKGDEADEGFLARRFRNLARMGPDIVDVVTQTLLNPALGLSRVVQLVAEKAREETGLDPV